MDSAQNTDTQRQDAPRPYPKGAPMSPRPHIFGDPPPRQPGRALPSDLLTMEDYRRLRNTAWSRYAVGLLGGCIITPLVVRQLSPRRLSRNALVLIGFRESFTELC